MSITKNKIILAAVFFFSLSAFGRDYQRSEFYNYASLYAAKDTVPCFYKLGSDYSLNFSRGTKLEHAVIGHDIGFSTVMGSLYVWIDAPGTNGDCMVKADTDNIRITYQGSSNSGHEQSIQCTNTGSRGVRTVTSYYDAYPNQLPCKVIYRKENGTEQTIASYQNTAGMCESKRRSFLNRLAGWGWDCN